MKILIILIATLFISIYGYSQHPIRPKFIDNLNIRKKHIGRDIKLFLIGKKCDTKYQGPYKCLQDSIQLTINDKVMYFQLLVHQTIEGWMYSSIHLSNNNYNDTMMLKIFHYKLKKLSEESIEVEAKIDFYDKKTTENVENQGFKILLNIDRKKLFGIYRPEGFLF